jgi:metal-responsive CopG/Arc/MetJ family transcriptional regulator
LVNPAAIAGVIRSANVLLIAELDELAAQRGVNRSEAATEAIRRFVKAKRKA